MSAYLIGYVTCTNYTQGLVAAFNFPELNTQLCHEAVFSRRRSSDYRYFVRMFCLLTGRCWCVLRVSAGKKETQDYTPTVPKSVDPKLMNFIDSTGT